MHGVSNSVCSFNRRDGPLPKINDGTGSRQNVRPLSRPTICTALAFGSRHLRIRMIIARWTSRGIAKLLDRVSSRLRDFALFRVIIFQRSSAVSFLSVSCRKTTKIKIYRRNPGEVFHPPFLPPFWDCFPLTFHDCALSFFSLQSNKNN